MANTMTIFDDVTSKNIASYWMTNPKNQAPYLWENEFPVMKQMSDTFSFIRGESQAPTPLAPSAYDAQAIMRGRAGLGKVTDKTRYFKEGKYIDENLRRQLINLSENGVQAEKDAIVTNIFNDSIQLVEAAALTREIMRNQLVQTGKVEVMGNGQLIQADYQMKDTHKATVATPWGTTGSKPFDDIKKAKQVVEDDSTQSVTRAVMNSTTFDALLHDDDVKGTMLYDNGKLQNVIIPQSEVLQFLMANYNLNVQIYDKSYRGYDGKITKWIPDGRVIFLTDQSLGHTIMTTTPEEVDLAAQSDIDLSVVDGGVAITTKVTSDPVNKKINVSQQVMPAFEQIDSVYNLDVFGAQTTAAPTTEATSGK